MRSRTARVVLIVLSTQIGAACAVRERRARDPRRGDVVTVTSPPKADAVPEAAALPGDMLLLPPSPPGPPDGWQPDAALTARLREEEPARWAEMDGWSETDPERFRDAIFRWQDEQRVVAALKATDPLKAAHRQRAMDLERRAWELVEEARSAPPSRHEAAVQDLRSALRELFAAREEARADEIARLRARLAVLEAALADRHAQQETIVERRLQQVLQRKDDLGW